MAAFKQILLLGLSIVCAAPLPAKETSVFFPAQLRQRARVNVQKYPWAKAMQKQIVTAAQPWREMSDDALWSLMFGNTIKRAWQVWSNGHCPACKQGVPMYNWQMDALRHPWKTRCPHCKELFPKNDFAKFYQSGLDSHGIFDPKRADRALLFNTEHPDPKDPQHRFGVDDGEGYVDGERRWRFIGAYLIFGQWKQAILGGVNSLAAAYVVTGDRAYAHKAGVLLDRVADLYPTMDFGKEGVMYEGAPRSGYVSTWHDACEETRQLALAYDMVREALREDKRLADFLAKKAQRFKPANPKRTPEDVCRNIEERILRDALRSRDKIYSNYPQTDITVAFILSVLAWPDNRSEVLAILDAIIEKATAVDGVTGEKGLAGYAAYAVMGTASLLAWYARVHPTLLGDLLKRHPRLRDLFRFHIDTWCLQKYYPQSGDTGAFAHQVTQYVGVPFSRNPGVTPSMFDLLGRLYARTGDAAFLQALYRANGDSVAGLPYDLFAEDPAGFQRQVQEVIAREGATPKLGSVNKEQWHLAILRSSTGAQERALWLDYDAGGAHGHADGMNLGLFARGLDLLPDFGYPPVQFGGWGAPRAVWYTMTAAHNTVVVDGRNQRAGPGKTTLWADGQQFRAIRASAPGLIEGKQYERTAALVDLSDDAFYVLDVFRVVGGTDHAKFLHSHFGQITTQGLSLAPVEDYGHDTQMRGFRGDPAPPPGWSVDWKIEDRHRYLPADADVHLRYTDLTTGVQVAIAEAWISVGGIDGYQEAWIPRVMTRRQAAEGPLASTFVGVLEPYEKSSRIARIRRLPLETVDGAAYPDPNVAVEITFTDGGRDLFVSADAENPLGLSPSRTVQRMLVQKGEGLRLDGELCLIRQDGSGAVRRIVLCRGRAIALGEVSVTLKQEAELIEIAFEEGRASVVSGRSEDVLEIRAPRPRSNP